MKQYLNLLQDVLENGTVKDDRTGTGTISAFVRQARYDLSQGFHYSPLRKSIYVQLFMNYYGF